MAVSSIFSFVDFVHFARFGPDSNSAVMEPNESQNGKRFFPSGAIFFFAVLILFYTVLWLVVYWIMVALSESFGSRRHLPCSCWFSLHWQSI